MSQAQPLTPPALDRVVRKCLAKDPDDRWQTAHDLHDELKWIAEGGPAVVPVGATRNPWPERAAWITAAAGVLIALFIILRPASAPATGDVVRLSILPPDKTLFTGQSAATVGVPQLALSPDGRAIVFAAAAPGARPTLWLRSLDAVTAHPLPGTEGAESPFWSPDNQLDRLFRGWKAEEDSCQRRTLSGDRECSRQPSGLMGAGRHDPLRQGHDWHSAGVIVRRHGHASH